MMSRNQVASERALIISPQLTTPAGATNQTKGVRNGRCAFGALSRNIMMPMQTTTKASR